MFHNKYPILVQELSDFLSQLKKYLFEIEQIP